MPSDLEPASASGTSLQEDSDARLAREKELLSQARADMAAGRGVAWDVVEAWLSRLDADEDAPAPEAAVRNVPDR